MASNRKTVARALTSHLINRRYEIKSIKHSHSTRKRRPEKLEPDQAHEWKGFQSPLI